jgi:polysaccharide export outer membrane protein
LTVGQKETSQKQQETISTDTSGKEYVVGSEDVLEIQVWGNDDLQRTVEISQEGAFTFPLIGKIHAAGLSVFELEQLLKKLLADGYLREPQVNVTVSKYMNQKIVVFGEVRKPGSYVIKGKTHIMEILSAAEGLTDRAGSIITIVRPQFFSQNNSLTASGDAKEHKIIEVDLDSITEGAADERFFILNGDSIYVSKAPRIFITGEVNKPGEYKWEKGLTVHRTVSLAGGPTKKGALNRVKVARTENGKEKIFKVDLDEIIMPDDIIQVPESYF